ncbi:MAG: hypothetical protein WBC91_08370 [Phototrophicaceae bacterium]
MSSSWVDQEIKTIISDANEMQAKLHQAEIQIAVLSARLEEAKEVQEALVSILKQMAVYEFILKQHGIDPETGQRIEDHSHNGNGTS